MQQQEEDEHPDECGGHGEDEPQVAVDGGADRSGDQVTGLLGLRIRGEEQVDPGGLPVLAQDRLGDLADAGDPGEALGEAVRRAGGERAGALGLDVDAGRHRHAGRHAGGRPGGGGRCGRTEGGPHRYGLIGMRNASRCLVAGGVDGGGFRVVASLPVAPVDGEERPG
ncbi:hypothetical protein ACFVUY_27070 [Kitasatospora sp. NPDC058063]|uniref:hypothetical protein n=1 Tax=Kitasatospora sp. NPDC058063 TaxID=3346321 RepID=UPI0036D830C6